MTKAFCLICSTYRKKRDRRSFFKVPECNIYSNSIEKELIERRRAEWLKLKKRNYNISKLFVCSDHFVSGEPAKAYKTEDIDWVPTKNLKTQPDNVPSSLNSSVLSTDVTGSFQSRNEEVSTLTAGCNNTIFEEQINLTDSSRTEFSVFQNGNDSMDESSHNQIRKKKYPTSDEAGLPEKRQKIASSNSDQEQNNGDQIAIEEPLKQKTVYCRPIQPMNGTWPRVTATIISPESINTAASVINLGLKAKLIHKPGEAADGVSKNSQSITVKKEMEDCSIADEPDCDLHAAYCFTSKLTVERGTQVTADEIRRAFQSTAATQTLWK
ncbi:uncharacterized protein LOC116923701 isoform X2 [Daphnia magna]|uniref:uncharacterized protein LOC116923701 isoform X2 n=1 Tax=Daphnia magna TaxID=35525 RepID=UPI00140272F0|nr:uncharacterized protein LOC116923701 isoform X2 [Daphnia magna]